MENNFIDHFIIIFIGLILVIILVLVVLQLMNKNNMKVIGTNKFKVKGKFKSFNFETGQFNFISIEGEEYSGFFDKLIKKNLDKIELMEVYEISISRIIEKQFDNQEMRITDSIISNEVVR